MQNELIEAMEELNNQIKTLDKELDSIIISELRRQRFFILSTYQYLIVRESTGSQNAVKSMPEYTNKGLL